MPPQSRTASRFLLVALLAIVGARASAQSAPVAPSDLNANFAGAPNDTAQSVAFFGAPVPSPLRRV